MYVLQVCSEGKFVTLCRLCVVVCVQAMVYEHNPSLYLLKACLFRPVSELDFRLFQALIHLRAFTYLARHSITQWFQARGCSLILVFGKCFRLYEVCVSQVVIMTGMVATSATRSVCAGLCVYVRTFGRTRSV